MNYKIAIDGPAGAGKSTIAKEVAKKLGFIYIDTGAMYRAMGVFFDRNDEEDDVEKLCSKADISINFIDGEQRVFLNGEDVSFEIRTEKAGMSASRVSALPPVREKLVELQQALAAKTSVVMDGRDIGTVVLPDAQLKIFLTADVSTRAKRRRDQLLEKGIKAELKDIEDELKVRDHNDSTRKASPLKIADGAFVVDSSCQTIDETANEIIRLFREKTGQ